MPTSIHSIAVILGAVLLGEAISRDVIWGLVVVLGGVVLVVRGQALHRDRGQRCAGGPAAPARAEPRRRDIQGLRALAVTMVVAYHARLPVPVGSPESTSSS
jgi:peptidoglycan/LPS O-acetylase OafA/YrhL